MPGCQDDNFKDWIWTENSHEIDHIDHGGISCDEHQECDLNHIFTSQMAGFELRKASPNQQLDGESANSEKKTNLFHHEFAD